MRWTVPELDPETWEAPAWLSEGDIETLQCREPRGPRPRWGEDMMEDE